MEARVMKTNEGTIDRAIRVIVALGLLALLAIGPVPGWGLVGLVGLLPLTTGLLGFCPMYIVFGIDTRGRKLHEAVGG